MKLKHIAASLALATVGLAYAAPVTISPFAQTVIGGTPVSATAVGGVTTITTTSTPVTIGGFYPGLLNVPAFLTLNAFSTSAAATSTIGTVTTATQLYTGNFSLVNGATNYLTGSFTNAVLSGIVGGTALALTSSDTIGDTTLVTLSSQFLTFNPLEAASFAFASVDPIVSIFNDGTGDTVHAFVASVSGTNSAESNVVPEPATALLVGLGMIGAMTARRRRSNKMAA